MANPGIALADFSSPGSTVTKFGAYRKARPPKLYHHFETALDGRVLRAALVSGGVCASLSRRALRSREILACVFSVSSSPICLTTRVVLSIAVSGLESYTLNGLFFVSFVNFQFPLLFRIGRTKVFQTSAK